MKMHRKIVFLPWILSLWAAFVLGQKDLPFLDRDKVSEVKTRDLALSSRPRKSSDATRSGLSRTADALSGSSFTTILQNRNEITRGQAWLRFLEQLDAEDFPQIAVDLKSSGMAFYRRYEYRAFLVAWTKYDPNAAIAYAQDGPISFKYEKDILGEWARVDPEGAIRWNEENSSDAESDSRFVAIISGISENDPDRATQLMLQLDNESEQAKACEVIIRALAKDGVEPASSWLGGLEIAEERKVQLSESVASELAKLDPAGAAAWVDSIADSRARSSAIEGLASTWSERDLLGAVAWVNSITGVDRQTAAVKVVQNYAEKDAVEAAVWMDSMVGEAGYEDIVTAFLDTAFKSEPALSLSYVSELRNEKVQYSFYSLILAMWRSDDPQAVEAWINANGIPDLVRTELQKNPAR